MVRTYKLIVVNSFCHEGRMLLEFCRDFYLALLLTIFANYLKKKVRNYVTNNFELPGSEDMRVRVIK